MTDRALIRLAWALCALTLLVLAASLVLILLGWSTRQGLTPWRDQAVSLVGIFGAPILGGLIASRRPRNAYGWVWLGFGLGLALAQLESSISAYARVVEPGTLVAPLAVTRCARAGESGGARSRTIPVAVFPHRAASLQTLASRGLDFGAVGSDDHAPRPPLRQP